MIEEVKKRIDQIRNGIVPEGYKKGKLGIVPREWDEIPFSTLFTSTSDYTDDLEKYPLYSLTIEDGITAKTERYERSHLVKKEKSYKVVRPNDYAYNPMNIRFGAVARHKGDIPVAVSGYYDIFTTVHKSDLVFMDSFLTCDPMITYYNKVSTGSLIEKQRVHFSDFLEFSLALPPLEERKKIAEILTTQDKVIELERQKIEEIMKIKQFFLGKMFPQKGQAVPEIRFKGFTDVWEQRKLSEVATMHARIGWQNLRTTEFLDSGDYMLITGTDFDDGAINFSTCHFVERERYEQDKHIQIKNGSILITKDGTLGKVAFVQGLSMPATLNAGVFNVEIKDETVVDNKYLFQYLKAPFLMDYVDKKATGGTIKHLNQNILADFPVLMPSKAEQEAIAVYVECLDNLITLHQRKLEEEKKKKKALMQLLLTGIVRV